jgi:hypothetical protein
MIKFAKGSLVLVSIVVAGCGGGGSTAGTTVSTPTSPTVTVSDLTGAWTETTGGALTWQLTQSGGTVTGTSSYTQGSGPLTGASVRGAISGSVASSTFTFTDSSTSISRPNCTIVATGSLTISGSQMTGRYTETDTCDGAVVFSGGGGITMRKQ